jgi:ribosome-binding factor A
MDTIRQNKVAKLLQKELGEVFQRESRNLFNGAFITVTMVKISPDMSIAKVYLSMFAVTDKKALLKHIKTQNNEVRKIIGNKLKNQLRIIPNFDYHIDDSLDYAMRIDELLKK